MGEAHKLTFDEASAVVRRAIARVAGRVPVVVGVSHSSLEVMSALARLAMDAGAGGVLVAPAAGLRTDDQTFAYYEAVAAALGPSIPWIYQDYPQSSARLPVRDAVCANGRRVPGDGHAEGGGLPGPREDHADSRGRRADRGAARQHPRRKRRPLLPAVARGEAPTA